jgi:hypothetical protein
MKKIAPQIVLLALFVIFLLSGVIVVKHFLGLPFRATNDALHQNDSLIVLDFLIPAGMHIDQYMTIAEVLKIRVTKKTSPFEKTLHSVSQLISPKYRYLADLLLFFFWSFVFMTFLRIFTFMGYGRALRVSLMMGGVSYYFMPDFSPGRIDDVIFLVIALFIILLRMYSRKKKKKKIFSS